MQPLLISTSQVCALLSVSAKTITRLVHEQGFPKPVKIGIARNLYDFEEVKNWLASKKELSH